MNKVNKHESAIVAPSAVVTGDVILEADVNIWHGSVIRGDHGRITIGAGTNIQDNCVLHDETTLGTGCTVGHGAIVHGCTVGDHSMIGIGAIVLSGAVIGRHCVIAAGAVVKENMVIPDGHTVMGVPARIIGETKQVHIDKIYQNEADYIALAKATLK